MTVHIQAVLTNSAIKSLWSWSACYNVTTFSDSCL